VNVTHQLSDSLGLSVFVVVFAAARSGTLEERELLGRSVAASLTAGAVMLAFALVLVLALIVRPGTTTKAAQIPDPFKST
jgi:hypothetical protein